MPRRSDVPLETMLHVRDTCLCLSAQRAARALARYFDEAFRPLDLTNGQFSLLMALNQPNPPPMGRIASFLAMDRTTLTAALKPLQRRGLVEVRPGQHDRRSRILSLKPAGRELLAQAVPIWTREHAKVEALMAADAPDQVRDALGGLARELSSAGSAQAGPASRAGAGRRRTKA